MAISGGKCCVPKDLLMHLIPTCLAGHFVNSDNRTELSTSGPSNTLHVAPVALYLPCSCSLFSDSKSKMALVAFSTQRLDAFKL